MIRFREAVADHWGSPLAWRMLTQVLPAVAFATAAFFVVRSLTQDGAPSSSAGATVDSEHAARLAADIQFFEAHVAETKDQLSYNRLTSLYLQRVRETGDISDVRRAELSATRSLENAPGDYAGLLYLAQVRVAEHEFEAAEKLATQAHDAIPTRPDALALLGDAEMALGRYDQAANHYQAYVDKVPGSSAFSRRAALAELQGQSALAEQFWKAAIDADRSDAPESSAWSRVQLGLFYFNGGKLDDAGNQFATALRVFPGYGAAEAGLGKVAAAKGDFSGAAGHYRKAVATLPLPDYVIALGDVLERAGKHPEAQQQYGLVGAIEQLFQANGVVNDLNLILFDADHGGDPAKAVEGARVAYEARPSLTAADAYGWALYRAGRLAEARAKAEEALRLGTRDPLLLFHAGAIASAQHDRAAAADFLSRALALNPRFSPRYENEARAELENAKGGR